VKDKKDFRTLYDPFNKFKTDYNPNKIKQIDKEIFEYYIKSPDCFTCLIQQEPIPKPCLGECKFNFRYRGGVPGKIKTFIKNNCEKRNCECIDSLKECSKTKSSPFIEIKKGGFNSDKYILLSRYTLVFNYYNKIPFIMRATDENGFDIHHVDSNKFNDSPDNLVFLPTSEHGSLTNKTTYLRRQINMEYSKKNPDKEKLDILIQERRDLMLNIRNSPLFESTVNEVNRCIHENIIYNTEEILNEN